MSYLFWEKEGVPFGLIKQDQIYWHTYRKDACLKIAANLINHITNTVFLMIASQFGLNSAYCCFKVVRAFKNSFLEKPRLLE